MILLVLNLVVAGYMTGLIWFVQLVHYPLFRLVGPATFGEYHRIHTARLGVLAGVPMVAEAFLSLALVALCPPAFPSGVAWLALALTGVTWGSTFLISVPLHNALGRYGAQPQLIDRLVWTNWPRTIAWSGRLALLATVLQHDLSH